MVGVNILEDSKFNSKNLDQVEDKNKSSKKNSKKSSKKSSCLYLCRVKRLVNLKYGFKGIYNLITDQSVLIHILLSFILVIVGYIREFTIQQWILQLILIILNVGFECCNTLIEKISDFIEPRFNDKIGFIKDTSAGMVLFIIFITVPANVLIYFL